MTTDTLTTASTPSPVLQLRIVRPAPGRCADASMQAALNDCAYEEFLEASAVMSRQSQAIEAGLKPAKRVSWRRLQKTWLTFRTEACQFESNAVAEVSFRPMIQWQCSTRMTKQRTAEPSRLTCLGSEVACPAGTQRARAQ